MKKSRQLMIAAVLVVYSVVTCQAHEGHGHENPLSPGHYIANPEHALPIALTLMAALAGGWLIYRTTARIKRK
jgi:hypothetical protein